MHSYTYINYWCCYKIKLQLTYKLMLQTNVQYTEKLLSVHQFLCKFTELVLAHTVNLIQSNYHNLNSEILCVVHCAYWRSLSRVNWWSSVSSRMILLPNRADGRELITCRSASSSSKFVLMLTPQVWNVKILALLFSLYLCLCCLSAGGREPHVSAAETSIWHVRDVSAFCRRYVADTYSYNSHYVLEVT